MAKLIIVALLAFLTAAQSCWAATSPNTWVNIKANGAIGNGSTDDGAAIQAAIDYTFANNLAGVYCPTGNYKTTNTIWLDPPNGMRAITWTGTGYISGTGLTIATTTAGTFGGVGSYIQTGSGSIGSAQPYSGSVAGATFVTAGTASPWTVNNSQTVGSSGSPVALTATTPAASSPFTFTKAFFGDPTSSAVKQPGCNINPTFNSGIAFVIGPGQGMRVSDIGVNGPNSGYRGTQSPYGIGIGIGTNGGGATGTLIEDTYVSNFYTLYQTDALGNGDLSDSNTFRKVGGSNAYFGIFLSGTQAYINDIVEPRIGDSDIFVSSAYSKQVNIFGGNLSTSSSQNNTFSISGTSKVTGTTYQTTVASPDSYIGTPVYNSYLLITPHNGVIPLTLTSWNSSTDLATFNIYFPWLGANYGRSTDTSSLNADILAATMLYAVERVITTQGAGITMDGTHIENPGVCTTVFDPTTVWGDQVSNEIRNIFFDYDPTLVSQGDAAEIACQESFPFVSVAAGQPLKLSGGDWQANAAKGGPLLIDASSGSLINGSQLNGISTTANWFNIRVYDQQGCAWSQIGGSGSSPYCTAATQFDTMARGSGQWDTDYFLPPAFAGTNASTQMLEGELTSPFCGYEPCPWTTPNLSTTIYSLVSGTLGAIGSYPPIACRTVFKSVDWNTAAVTPPSTVSGGIFKRSASCPGYSYGQNLTQATIGSTANATGTGYIDNGSGSAGTVLHWASTTGSLVAGDTIVSGGTLTAGTYVVGQTSGTAGGTGSYTVSQSQLAGSSGSPLTITAPSVTWSYEGVSSALYLDAATIKWIFPGLGISLNNGSGSVPYIVTGVYPQYGYATVINATANAGGMLAGSDNVIYSCSASCTIAQAPFAWTAY